MRFLFIFTLVFYINFASAAQLQNESVEIEVDVTAVSEAEVKKKAFETALKQASLQILHKYAPSNQRHLINDIVSERALHKFFSKVDVVTSAITDKGDKKNLIGTFHFIFEIEDVKRWLSDNDITFIAHLAKHYNIVQIPIFIEGNQVYHWFDSTIVEAFLSNLKQINNFHIYLVEPNIEVVKIELQNKYRMHQLAQTIQKGIDYDGYNLIICEVFSDKGKLECENHLIYDGNKLLERITLNAANLDDGMQLMSEINSVYLGDSVVAEQAALAEQEASKNEGGFYLELRYEELSDLLRFQKLLTQNPYVAQYKVRESGFGSTRFLVQIRSDFKDFEAWMAENNISSSGIEDSNSGYDTYIFKVK